MEETSREIVEQKFAKQSTFFATHQTKEIDFRLANLKKLKQVVLDNEENIKQALWEDLHKSPEEAYLTEINIVVSEIDHHIKNIKKWAKPKKVSTTLQLQPSSSNIIYEPLGIALIVAPWNYPFQLLINPLVGAISAGCCAILKPSPDTPKIAKLMEAMIADTFISDYITVVQGGRETNTRLLAQPFDLMFFTGSSKVGKVVMKAASEHLSKVILELGGKSPCIVDADADIDIAAKRIAWGKLINAGQTCIAPDYLFAHKSIKDELLNKIAENISAMYGENLKESRFYPRVVNDSAFERLTGLLNEGTIHTGGDLDAKERFFPPTIIDDVQPGFKIMQEEIFGPILPVLSFGDIEEAVDYINKNPKPLALYYFGKTKNAEEVLSKTTSGGACINDVLMHITNHNLPFGGVGNSGLGSYHGKESFIAFSHKRGVVTTPTWIDIPFKYIPFKYFELVKKFVLG